MLLGVGKTEALKTIGSQLLEHGVPVLVIDFQGDNPEDDTERFWLFIIVDEAKILSKSKGSPIASVTSRDENFLQRQLAIGITTLRRVAGRK